MKSFNEKKRIKCRKRKREKMSKAFPRTNCLKSSDSKRNIETSMEWNKLKIEWSKKIALPLKYK